MQRNSQRVRIDGQRKKTGNPARDAWYAKRRCERYARYIASLS